MELLAAIGEAKAAGIAVQWPSRPEGLASIAISATAASGAQETTPARTARKRKGK